MSGQIKITATGGHWDEYGVWIPDQYTSTGYTINSPSAFFNLSYYWLCKHCGQFNSIYPNSDKCAYCHNSRAYYIAGEKEA